MIPTTKNWLNGLNVNAANYNDKPDDMSIDALVMLLNEGYDRVTWIGSDRDKEENEICQRYDTNQTTWELEAFININAAHYKGLKVVARIMDKDEYSEKDWNKIINSPGKSLKYAQEHGFVDLPLEIIESIASDDLSSSRFIHRFLKVNQTEAIPQPIVEAALVDVYDVELIYQYYKNNPNLPEEIKEMARGTRSEDGGEIHYFNNQKGTAFQVSDAKVPFRAPIFSHSHVGCQCYLKVWKSTDPDDCVFVDANGW